MAGGEQFAFKAEIQQLLNILVHSLYTDREIFLRELISNASDALNRVQFEGLTNPDILDADAELYIEVKPDDAAGTLTISDTGIGMTRDDLANNLGVIAHSGAKSFIEALKQRQDANGSGAAANVIGQFGVGFYSVFMVADRVRVVSRSHDKDGSAWAWESTGGDTYTIEPAERETRGTDIIITLKEDAKEFAQPWKLKDIVRRHSNYIAFPIYVGDDEDAANKQTALWRQEPKEVTDEAYQEFYKSLTYDWENPLHRIHMRADTPIQFYALLYIPTKAPREMLIQREPGLQLYARKVLIQERTEDLLPDYLQFVQGVVDSEDLPLNVSRESVQANRVMATLKKTLTNKVLTELKRMIKSKPDEYHKIFAQFGRYLKQGVAVAPTDRAEIEPLLMFPSTRGENADQWVTFAEYTERAAENQTDIYYVIGDDYASASRSPHLDAFRKRGIEVLYFIDPSDTVMLMGLPDVSGHRLRNVDEADIDLSEIGTPQADDEAETPAPLESDSFGALRERFAELLGERVKDVRESKNLSGSPARLVSDDANPGRNMFRINRLLDRDYELPVKILELNPRHPLLHNLSALLAESPDSPLLPIVIEQVFETALLQDGIHPDPAGMADRLVQLMQAATRNR
ncbi:MAG: molecular chaperone HtpG [bacterium]|nr:molecular chaperone HtpG [bacterium]